MKIDNVSIVPDWLKEGLEKNCPYCGSEYEIGLSPNGQRVTRHYCPNDKCLGTIATKMAFVWTLLKVDGIKFGKSLKLVKESNIEYHLDAVPIVIKDKVKIPLEMYMRLTCINGIDTGWGHYCDGKEKVEEVLEITSVRSLLTDDEVTNILRCVNYFEILKPTKMENDPVVIGTIMITGNVLNFQNREDYVGVMNAYFKGLLDLRYSKSKRRTGIMALIKEKGAPVTGKVTTAEECGIPIMEPLEFAEYIKKLIKERTGKDYEY